MSTWVARSWTNHSRTTVVVDDPTLISGKRVIAEFETEDDARLGAAAPEMLLALQLAKAHLPEPSCAIWRHVHDVVNAAIIKVMVAP